MKKILFLLFSSLLLIVSSAMQTDEKIIDIKDLRSLGFSAPHDTSTVGHQVNDLFVIRTTGQGSGTYARHDSLDLYNVHFIKLHKGKPKNYVMIYNDLADYDKASYKWLNDTVISFHLINSLKKTRKGVHIIKSGELVYTDSKLYD